MAERTCADCGRPRDKHGARGRCNRCYNRLRREERAADSIPCSIKGCDGFVRCHSGTLCERHRSQKRYHGRIIRAERKAKPRKTSQKKYAEIRGRLLAEQGGKCKCCNCLVDPDDAHLDHDHVCCGEQDLCERCIRGVLCRTCNVALGMFGDNVPLLLAAAQYVMTASRIPYSISFWGDDYRSAVRPPPRP